MSWADDYLNDLTTSTSPPSSSWADDYLNHLLTHDKSREQVYDSLYGPQGKFTKQMQGSLPNAALYNYRPDETGKISALNPVKSDSLPSNIEQQLYKGSEPANPLLNTSLISYTPGEGIEFFKKNAYDPTKESALNQITSFGAKGFGGRLADYSSEIGGGITGLAASALKKIGATDLGSDVQDTADMIKESAKSAHSQLSELTNYKDNQPQELANEEMIARSKRLGILRGAIGPTAEMLGGAAPDIALAELGGGIASGMGAGKLLAGAAKAAPFALAGAIPTYQQAIEGGSAPGEALGAATLSGGAMAIQGKILTGLGKPLTDGVLSGLKSAGINAVKDSAIMAPLNSMAESIARYGYSPAKITGDVFSQNTINKFLNMSEQFAAAGAITVPAHKVIDIAGQTYNSWRNKDAFITGPQFASAFDLSDEPLHVSQTDLQREGNFQSIEQLRNIDSKPVTMGDLVLSRLVAPLEERNSVLEQQKKNVADYIDNVRTLKQAYDQQLADATNDLQAKVEVHGVDKFPFLKDVPPDQIPQKVQEEAKRQANARLYTDMNEISALTGSDTALATIAEASDSVIPDALKPTQVDHSKTVKERAKELVKDVQGDPFVNPVVSAQIQAYYDANPHDPLNPEVKASYDALKSELLAQFKDLQVKVDLWDSKDGQAPYQSKEEMNQDIRNGHYWLQPVKDLPIDHPLGDTIPNEIPGKKLNYDDILSITHAFFGEGGVGNDAYEAHASLLSGNARKAFAWEMRGKTDNSMRKANVMPPEYTLTNAQLEDMLKAEDPAILIKDHGEFEQRMAQAAKSASLVDTPFGGGNIVAPPEIARKAQEVFARPIPYGADTEELPQLYHGTGEKHTEFPSTKAALPGARTNMYGPGIYATNNEGLAETYSAPKEVGGWVHKIFWAGDKPNPVVVHAESPMPNSLKVALGNWANKQQIMVLPGESKGQYEVYSDNSLQHITDLLSRPGVTLKEAYPILANAPEGPVGLNKAIHDAGYDAIRYDGGVFTSGKHTHDAYVFLKPEHTLLDKATKNSRLSDPAVFDPETGLPTPGLPDKDLIGGRRITAINSSTGESVNLGNLPKEPNPSHYISGSQYELAKNKWLNDTSQLLIDKLGQYAPDSADYLSKELGDATRSKLNPILESEAVKNTAAKLGIEGNLSDHISELLKDPTIMGDKDVSGRLDRIRQKLASRAIEPQSPVPTEPTGTIETDGTIKQSDGKSTTGETTVSKQAVTPEEAANFVVSGKPRTRVKQSGDYTPAVLKQDLQTKFGLDQQTTATTIYLMKRIADAQGLSFEDYVAKTFKQIEQGDPNVTQRNGEIQFVSDGRAIIRAFQGADVTTVFHELGHVLMRSLPESSLKSIESALGVKNGEWTEAHKEAFANMFEAYLGNNPKANIYGSAVERALNRTKDWFNHLYSGVLNSPLEITIPKEVMDVFNKTLLTGEKPDRIASVDEVLGQRAKEREESAATQENINDPNPMDELMHHVYKEADGRTFVEKMKDFGKTVYNKWMDISQPIVPVFQKYFPQGLDYIRAARGAEDMAHTVLNDNTILFDSSLGGSGGYKATGEGMRQILAPLDKVQRKDMSRYMAAEAQLELAINLAQKKAEIADLESIVRPLGNLPGTKELRAKLNILKNDLKNGPVIRQGAVERAIAQKRILEQKWGQSGQLENMKSSISRMRDWSVRAVVDPLVEIGFITNQDKQNILLSRQYYAPLYKLAERLGKEMGDFQTGPKGSPSFERLTTDMSNGGIIDPLVAFALKATAVQTFVARQRVRNALGAVLEANSPETGNRIINELHGFLEIDPNRNDKVIGGKWDREDTLDTKDRFYVWKNGQKRTYVTDKPTIEALNGLTPRQSDGFFKALQWGAALKRMGATLAPGFALRNPGRDQTTAARNSKFGYIPYWDFAKGLLAMSGKNQALAELYSEAVRNGAFLADKASVDLQDLSTRVENLSYDSDSIKSMFKQDLQGGRWNNNIAIASAKAAVRALGTVSQTFEKGTRAGLYIRARQSGATIGEAVRDAREGTIDFRRYGKTMQRFNQMVPFANAEIQDVDKTITMLREDGLKGALKIFTWTTLPAILNFAVNKDDKEYNQLAEWDKALFYHPFKLPNGMFMRWPRGIGVIDAIAGYGVEKVLSVANGNEATKDAAIAVANQFSQATPLHYVTSKGFDALPATISPAVQAWANKDEFKQGAPIIPQAEQGLSPELQGQDTMGPVAHGISRATGMSPYIAHYLIGGYTATLGKMVENAGNEVQGWTPPGQPQQNPAVDAVQMLGFSSRRPIGFGSKSVTDFYNKYQTSETAYKDYNNLVASGNTDKALEIARNSPEFRNYSFLSSVKSELADKRRLLKEITLMKGLPEARRQEYITQINEQVSQLTILALQGIK